MKRQYINVKLKEAQFDATWNVIIVRESWYFSATRERMNNTDMASVIFLVVPVIAKFSGESARNIVFRAYDLPANNRKCTFNVRQFQFFKRFPMIKLIPREIDFHSAMSEVPKSSAHRNRQRNLPLAAFVCTHAPRRIIFIWKRKNGWPKGKSEGLKSRDGLSY